MSDQNMCMIEGETEAEREEARRLELERLRCIDRPIESDPWGNGIIGALGGGLASFATGVGSVFTTMMSATGLGREVALEPFRPGEESDPDCRMYEGMY